MADVPAMVDSRLLGHSNVRMTLPYVHAADTEIEAAAERVGAAIARAMAHLSKSQTRQPSVLHHTGRHSFLDTIIYARLRRRIEIALLRLLERT